MLRRPPRAAGPRLYNTADQRRHQHRTSVRRSARLCSLAMDVTRCPGCMQGWHCCCPAHGFGVSAPSLPPRLQSQPITDIPMHAAGSAPPAAAARRPPLATPSCGATGGLDGDGRLCSGGDAAVWAGGSPARRKVGSSVGTGGAS